MKIVRNITLAALLFFPVSLLGVCSEKNTEIEIYPVKKIELEVIDKSLSERGELIFEVKYIARHKLDSKFICQNLKGITKIKRPEWIMNMILNPEQMTKENEIANQLFKEYKSLNVYQDVSRDDTRALLEYFRLIDGY